MFESIGIINFGLYVIGAGIVIAMPGPNTLYVLSTATRRGVAAGYKAACAIFLGDSIIMFLAAIGVDSLIRLYPNTFRALQCLGAAYLAWVGLKALHAVYKGESAAANDPHAACQEDPFRRALLLSLTNPKAIMFFVSFFVQFVDPSKGHPALAFFVLACYVQLVSVTNLSFLIFCGSKLARIAQRSQLLSRLGSVLVGCIFIGFGIRLAVSALG